MEHGSEITGQKFNSDHLHFFKINSTLTNSHIDWQQVALNFKNQELKPYYYQGTFRKA